MEVWHLTKDKNKDAKEEQTQTVIGQTAEVQQSYFPGLPPHSGMELARIYFPIQKLGAVYSPTQALKMGTLFPELYRPYSY